MPDLPLALIKSKFLPVLWIRDVYPGFQIRLFFHPGSASKNISILTPKKPKKFKKWFLSSRRYDPGCSSRIRMLTFYPPGSRIQGSKRHRIPDPDPQHWVLLKASFFVFIFKLRLWVGFLKLVWIRRIGIIGSL